MNATFGADLTTDGPDRNGVLRNFPPVRLAMADGSMREATITVKGGMVIMFR